MNILNLKALGDKIRAVFINFYDLLLNKIAIKSKAYKQLYNDYNSFLIINKHLPEISATLRYTKIGSLIRFLIQDLPGSIGTLNGFDVSIIRMTEPNDVLVVADEFEKMRVINEMKHFSGSGQVLTVEDLYDPKQKLNTPLGKVYVFSSIWLKDLITLENIVYIIENEKEEVKL